MTTPRFYDSSRLVATQSAVRYSRLFVIRTLDKWGTRFVINDAVHVVEALATNAVEATGVMDERVLWPELTRIEFITARLLGLEDSIRIDVWDSHLVSDRIHQRPLRHPRDGATRNSGRRPELV